MVVPSDENIIPAQISKHLYGEVGNLFSTKIHFSSATHHSNSAHFSIDAMHLLAK